MKLPSFFLCALLFTTMVVSVFAQETCPADQTPFRRWLAATEFYLWNLVKYALWYPLNNQCLFWGALHVVLGGDASVFTRCLTTVTYLWLDITPNPNYVDVDLSN